MKFFADTADFDAISELAEAGLIDGVTTNPSLIKKSGRDFLEVVADIARIVSEAIQSRRRLRLDYYKSNEDEFSERVVEPYALINGQEGWYVASFDPARGDVRQGLAWIWERMWGQDVLPPSPAP